MHKALWFAVISVAVAIAITSVMDGTGYTNFSALPLCPLLLLFWYLLRVPRKEIGFTWGPLRLYGLALLYPLLVMDIIVLIATAAGVIDTSHTHWGKAGLNLALIALTTVPVVLLTEEGFFRGWLFASLKQAGLTTARMLILSSVAFALWHWSWVTLAAADAQLPTPQIPLFLVNAAIIGATWGILRLWSGSLLVSSVSHGLWNGLAYVLFGYGTKVGALGIKDTALFGPEVGVLGLTFNIMCVLLLWYLWRKQAGKTVLASMHD